MPNYGDVALNLGADWDRARMVFSPYLLTTVGHVNGKADMHLEKQPDELHQFQWINPFEKDKEALAKMKGYKFVRKSDDWYLNDELWQWDAEGFVDHAGTRAMYRPASLYYKDQAQMTEEQKRRKRQQLQAEDQADQEAARKGGFVVTDESGQQLRPRRREARL